MPSKEGNKALLVLSIGALFIGISILVLTFQPVIKEELTYTFNSIQKTDPEEIVPVDEEFGIVIPKIQANARIIQNVDPINSAVYQRALTKGVAHAKGTVLPGEIGNMFLFAHSSDNFYNANRYNSVFYLLTKLDVGDEIFVFFDGEKHEYAVTSSKIVDAERIEFLNRKRNSETITLMTCWPPGTTLKRYIVEAQKITP